MVFLSKRYSLVILRAPRAATDPAPEQRNELMPPSVPLRLRLTPYHSAKSDCASQQIQVADVRSGSKADIATIKRDVRFTPNSGHWNSAARCPLCAKSGLMHRSKTAASFDDLVSDSQKTWRDDKAKRFRCGEIEG
jgi:hypothetical protein